jgi:hypothetical protein
LPPSAPALERAIGRLPWWSFGYWTGLGPDDSILALRDISQQDLYALEMKFP